MANMCGKFIQSTVNWNETSMGECNCVALGRNFINSSLISVKDGLKRPMAVGQSDKFIVNQHELGNELRFSKRFSTRWPLER